MRRRWLHWVLWAGGIAGTTLLLLAVRARLDKTHVALVYLILVLAGSVAAGRRVGLALAAVAFLLFNWFFLPPYGTLVIADPLDWLVLIAFLVVSTVAAQMLHWLQAEAEDSRQRADEVDRLATLGAETLTVARAEEALAAITEMIRSTLHVPVCRLHAASDGGAVAPDKDLVAWVAESGRTAVRLGDGTTRLSETGTAEAEHGGVRSLLLPLRVRDRTVGVLELDSDRPFSFDPAQRRFLSALAYYAALGLERVRLEAEAGRAEALREADRLKDALLASVSHDLRTPLTTIKALAYELADRGDERALAIGEEADRLNRLVADLLDLSGLKGGALPVRIELNAVDDLLGAVVQRVSGALRGRELRVAMGDGGTFLVGQFDFKHAMRILVNLIENAHKYAPPGSAVDLLARTAGDRLLLTVADRGPGIAPSEWERIFEPFYRPPGTPPDVGGTGLGLAIARQLAEVQGGSLTYAPRHGGGSCFTLALPASELPAAGESL